MPTAATKADASPPTEPHGGPATAAAAAATAWNEAHDAAAATAAGPSLTTADATTVAPPRHEFSSGLVTNSIPFRWLLTIRVTV